MSTVQTYTLPSNCVLSWCHIYTHSREVLCGDTYMPTAKFLMSSAFFFLAATTMGLLEM